MMPASTRATVVRFTIHITTRPAYRDIDRVGQAVKRLFAVGQGASRITQSYGVARSSRVQPTALRRGEALFERMDDLVGRRAVEPAYKSMQDAMKAGAEFQRAALDAAITQSGLNRMAGMYLPDPFSVSKHRRVGGRHGGSAGRNDTGAMIDGITWNADQYTKESFVRVRGGVNYGGTIDVTGYYGWTDPGEAYFMYQEKGTSRTGWGGGVPPANSLGTALIPTRSLLVRLLARRT